MSLINANEETYSEITIFGKPALYTILRVDRDTVPDGLYLYHIRHADDGEPATVELSVLVNHMATILVTEPIPLIGDKDQYKEITNDNINFCGNEITLNQFMEKIRE